MLLHMDSAFLDFAVESSAAWAISASRAASFALFAASAALTTKSAASVCAAVRLAMRFAMCTELEIELWLPA